MNITRVKLLTRYAQRVWKFNLDGREFRYVTNRKHKFTEVYTFHDDGERLYYMIERYLPLRSINREQDIRKFFTLLMLQ
jgi:hypothetical protein